MNALRNYQQELYFKVRDALKTNSSVAIQLHTGAGKTAIFTAMCESVYRKGKRAWIIVPRKELVRQSSEHLSRWCVPHGIIDSKNKESNAFNIFVVSKDTIIRRYDKIKNFPDLLIFDECHLYIQRQKEIISFMPKNIKTLGYSATMERLDGIGLSKKSGGVYDIMIEGPSIPWLTERGYLSPLRYFSPPLEGLSDLHIRGTDYDEEELEQLLQRRKIYGEVVGHYERYGKGRPALGFCRSVKSAYQMAERFRDKGYKFYCVEGAMSDGTIKDLLEAHREGRIDGLTTCDLVLYGVDIPRVEYGFSIRPTLSRAVYMQMIGRVLRPYVEYEMKYNHESGLYEADLDRIKYLKKSAIWMDHVNMVLEHQDEKYPGMPLHYVPEITWNFHGTEKRKRDKTKKNIVLCPHLDFMYCNTPHCTTCSHNPDKSIRDVRRPMVIIPAELEEIKPVPMSERPPDERRELQDEIGAAVLDYKVNMAPGAVGKLLALAESLGYREMWVYNRLTDESRMTINIPLLAEIARQKGYKPGWVWVMKQKLINRRSA